MVVLKVHKIKNLPENLHQTTYFQAKKQNGNSFNKFTLGAVLISRPKYKLNRQNKIVLILVHKITKVDVYSQGLKLFDITVI